MAVSAAAAPLIEARSLGFAVEGTPLLEDVSFALPRGEALAILGPNGAGKTTLLRCLLHIHRGHRGEIRVAGRPLASLRPRERARLLSYVPQLEGRSVPFTVREFVEMGRYAYLEPFAGLRPEDRAAVERALDLTGMTAFTARPLATLSGGERQQVYVAAALAQEAEALVLDEPTAFLDYGHRVRIHEILGAVRAEARTSIVLVTHDVNEAVAVADRALALRQGRVAFEGCAAELLDPALLESVYGVPFALVPREAGAPPLVVPAAPTGSTGLGLASREPTSAEGPRPGVTP